jgi:hypothetical protein
MTISPVGVMLSKEATAYPTAIQTWLNRSWYMKLSERILSPLRLLT